MGFFSRLFGKNDEDHLIDFGNADPFLQHLYQSNQINNSDFNYYNSPLVPTKQMYEDLYYSNRISEYQIPEIYRSEVVDAVDHVRSGYTSSELDMMRAEEEEREADERRRREENEEERRREEEEDERYRIITHPTPEWNTPNYERDDQEESSRYRRPEWHTPSYDHDDDNED